MLTGRVAIVTGGARGIGLAISEELHRLGAAIVVADSGVSISGDEADAQVAASIAQRLGANAAAFAEDIAAPGAAERAARLAVERFGALDIVVNNAAILRDAFIFKAARDGWERVIASNLTAPFALLAAATPLMREQQKGGRAPGRIVNIVSSAGLFGNFGQANYGAAKAGMVGLMNVLAEEGRKNNIRVNTISPTAATRMTEELLPPQALALMRPEAITPAVEFLLSEDAPTRTIMGAGAGSFAVIKIIETEGINLAQSDWTPDAIAAHFAEIDDVSKAKALQGAFEQTQKYVAQAAARAGIKL